jgi:uncharacterized protein with PQ loop repeat
MTAATVVLVIGIVAIVIGVGCMVAQAVLWWRTKRQGASWWTHL